MVEATDAVELDDSALLNPLDGPAFRCVLGQRKMSPSSIIIIGVASKDAFQMALSQDDHVIQTFPTYRADDSFCIGILPGRPACRRDFLDSERDELL